MHYLLSFFCLTATCLVLALSAATGQNFDAFTHPGLPLITSYRPATYQAHEQVWAALEGPDGRFYFANGDGLLVYDNSHWELVILTNKSHVRSLAFSPDSVLYLGGDGELGYVQTDIFGRLQYISLLSKLPPSERIFGRVWTTAHIGGKMYFQTYERLFVWDGKAFRIYPTGGKLLRSFPLNGILYGSMEGKGLVYWAGKEFIPAPGGSYFAGKAIRIILPYGQNQLLIGTEAGELFLYNRQGLVPFRTEAATQLNQYGLERGCRLDEEHFALALGSSGLYIFNRQGKLLQRLDDESGLCSNRILGCYVDRKGNLWLGTQSGISRVALGEPLRLMDRQTGLRGSVSQLVMHEGKLFAGTKEGLFVARQQQDGYADFQRIDFFRDRIWALHPLGASLLIGHTDGVYEWRNGELTQLNTYLTPAEFYPSAAHPGLIWTSLDDGCLAMQYKNGKWLELGAKRDLPGSVRGLVEYRKDEVWLGSRARGVYRLRFDLVEDSLPDPGSATVRNFAAADGLPPGDAIPLLTGNRLYVFVEQAGQVFAYEEKPGKFIPDSSFTARLGLPEDRLVAWYTQADGTLWLRTVHPATRKNTLVRVKKQADGHSPTQTFAIPGNISSFAHCLYIHSGKAFFGGLEGILTQELNPPADNSHPGNIAPLLTGVQLQKQPLAFRQAGIRLPFTRNAALRLQFAAPFFSATDQISYQTRLAGFEDTWSAWSRENYKEYTNLWEGTYEFQVRAMDAYGRISRVSGWPFAVTPPWYRQRWMYAIYLVSMVSMAYGIMRWRSLRLEQKNRRLENTVAERTAQLALQHDQLKEQSEQLRQMDTLKSRFFANISHEFRTPLTLITGLVRKHQGNLTADKEEDYRIILHNAHQLLRLINQLLELSRLEAGGARLQARQADLMPFLQQITASFASLAEQRQITFTFNKTLFALYQAVMPVYLYFDAGKLEQVITNLLGNALKFTPEQGAVDISVAVVDHAVEIQVRNSGPGIPAASLPYIFDRFYQADGTGYQGGTGIGLALVKELVALHHGSVHVESTPGDYTVFYLRLPLGNTHLSPGELAGEEDKAAEPFPLTAQLNNPADMAPSLAGEPGRPLVLVVEDNPDLRRYIKGQLSAGYLVLEAEGGEQGWQVAEETLPDLVISDLMMPGISGLALLERLKNSDKTSHIPVILLTARAGHADKLEGLSTGADDYLVKPFDADELLIRAGNLIRMRQQLREKFSAGALPGPEQVRLPSQQQVFLEKLYRVLDQHLDNELFGVEQLGGELGMSRSQIHRKVKAITNQSPSDLIRAYRLQRAADLIRQDAGNMSEIAWQTGFSSLSNFSRCFHEQYGCSPSEFKKRYASPT
jgi:signal transduction histidine kinase/CheY-like chemotaxis protein